MYGCWNTIEWRKSYNTKIYYKEIGAFGLEEKEFKLIWTTPNYLNGDYYAGLDVGFDYTMLERLRGYTEYTTTYSDPNIGSPALLTVFIMLCVVQ